MFTFDDMQKFSVRLPFTNQKRPTSTFIGELKRQTKDNVSCSVNILYNALQDGSLNI
jgi:hypothetical protein